MPDGAVEFLEYGVLGLCAITLILVWRILASEQKREGFPRKGILQACYVFMGFCLALAFLTGYLQLKETGVGSDEGGSSKPDDEVAAVPLVEIYRTAFTVCRAQELATTGRPELGIRENLEGARSHAERAGVFNNFESRLEEATKALEEYGTGLIVEQAVQRLDTYLQTNLEGREE